MIKEILKKNTALFNVCKQLRYSSFGRFLSGDKNRKKFIINLWQVKWFDKKNKTNFSGRILQEELGIDRNRANDYSASPKKVLLDILKKEGIRNTDSIIDMGSGKGMAMYFMLKFPFHEVAGVELAECLCPIAEHNLELMYPDDHRYIIYNVDAGKFKDYDRFNYIYIYNSFPKSVLAEVIENICTSLESAPRKIKLIYVYPEYPEVIEQCGKFSLLYNNPKMLRGGAWLFENII